jgi:excisionase family DNA binding protein
MLTPGDLARMLSVIPKTITRWAREGKLSAAVTPGTHRRYPLPVVLAFLREMGLDDRLRETRYALSHNERGAGHYAFLVPSERMSAPLTR